MRLFLVSLLKYLYEMDAAIDSLRSSSLSIPTIFAAATNEFFSSSLKSPGMVITAESNLSPVFASKPSMAFLRTMADISDASYDIPSKLRLNPVPIIRLKK